MSGEVSKGVANIANAVRTNSDKLVENMVGFVGKIFGADKAASDEFEPLQLYKKIEEVTVQSEVASTAAAAAALPNPFGLFDQMVQKVGNILRVDEPSEPLTLYRKVETDHVADESISVVRSGNNQPVVGKSSTGVHGDSTQHSHPAVSTANVVSEQDTPQSPVATISVASTTSDEQSKQPVLQSAVSASIQPMLSESDSTQQTAVVSGITQQTSASSNEEPEIILRSRRKR